MKYDSLFFHAVTQEAQRKCLFLSLYPAPPRGNFSCSIELLNVGGSDQGKLHNRSKSGYIIRKRSEYPVNYAQYVKNVLFASSKRIINTQLKLSVIQLPIVKPFVLRSGIAYVGCGILYFIRIFKPHF